MADTDWDAETRAKFAEVIRQETEVMEKRGDSKLEQGIIRRKLHLYRRLAAYEQNIEASRRKMSELYDECCRAVGKLEDHVREVQTKKALAQDEIDQSNLALHAIRMGAQET